MMVFLISRNTVGAVEIVTVNDTTIMLYLYTETDRSDSTLTANVENPLC